MAFRDMTIPYTDQEIQDLRDIFRSLPTCTNDTILTTDFPALVIGMRYERTPEQIQAYQKYWLERNGGKLTLADFLDSAQSVYKTSLYAKDYAVKADKNQDGVISAEEFSSILELMQVHDPKLQGRSYEDFVKEADTNEDGEVDIEELTKWIEKYSTRPQSEQWIFFWFAVTYS